LSGHICDGNRGHNAEDCRHFGMLNVEQADQLFWLVQTARKAVKAMKAASIGGYIDEEAEALERALKPFDEYIPKP
jgi:hypothetical protein